MSPSHDDLGREPTYWQLFTAFTKLSVEVAGLRGSLELMTQRLTAIDGGEDSSRGSLATAKTEAAQLRGAVEELRRLADGIQRDLAELLSKLTEDRLNKMVVFLTEYDTSTAEKRQYDLSLRVSLVTMVLCVLFFSIIAPAIQHWLFR